MYIKKIKQAGNFLIISEYGAKVDSHKGHRAKKHKSTTDSVKNYNQKLRGEKVLELILCNFENGYFITLKYLDSNHPTSYQAAEKNIRKLIDYVRLAARQQGIDFKCIWITERGHKENRLHHHIVIENNKIIREIIYKIWNGGIHKKRIGTDWQYKELADYIVKPQGKEERKKRKPLYRITRNLLKAKTIIYELHNMPLHPKPVSPSGYEVLHNSFICGTVPLLGIPYQKYLCRKINIPNSKTSRKPIKTKHGGEHSLPHAFLKFPPSIIHISR